MNTLPENDHTKMQAARLLIEEKRYETARELLKGLTNCQATDWMLKLDSMTPKRRVNRWSWAWALVVILVLVCGILGTTLVIRERDTNTRIWQAQKFDSVLAERYIAKETTTTEHHLVNNGRGIPSPQTLH